MATDKQKDLILALRNLGYKTGEATERANGALDAAGDEASLSSLITLALKNAQNASTAHEEAEEEEDEEEVVCEAPGPAQLVQYDPTPLPRKAHAPVPHFKSKPRKPTHGPRFHWRYFLLIGWWFAPVTLLLRTLLYGMLAAFEDETKAESSFKSTIGFW